MKAYEVDIGKNSQGIIEHAPVLEVVDDYSVKSTVDQDTLKKHNTVVIDAFYSTVVSVLSGQDNMALSMKLLDKKIKSSNNEMIKAFYAAHFNGSTVNDLVTAWNVLLHEKNLPRSLGPVRFTTDGLQVVMHTNLQAVL
jgi:hypothetical protein